MSEPYPPPPSYDLSQQQFDGKVSRVLEASISEASDNYPEEVWEVWDDAVFEEAQAPERQAGGSSSSTVISTSQSQKHPSDLPSVKKRPVSVRRPKEKPSWLAEAGLSPDSSSSALTQPPSTDGHSSAHYDILHSIIDDEDDEDRSIPPPPWAAVGPSLDGPPFEEVVLSLPSHRGRASNPPSPLSSPPLRNASPLHPPSPQPATLEQHPPFRIPRQPLTNLRKGSTRMGPRPRPVTTHDTNTTYRPSPPTPPPLLPPPPPPQVRFDSSMAYTGTRHAQTGQQFSLHHQSQHQPSHLSFYKYAISFILSTSTRYVFIHMLVLPSPLTWHPLQRLPRAIDRIRMSYLLFTDVA